MLPGRLAFRRALRTAAAVLLGAVAGCGPIADPAASSPATDVAAPEARGTAAATAAASAAPTPRPIPTPTPTPEPTRTFTNRADAELIALLPRAVGEVPIVVAADHALTPGDVGEPFGDVGSRFRSLAIAFTEPPAPRLSLYAMRADPPAVDNADLEAHLAEIGRYVGIAGLDRAAWELATVADREVWWRGEDAATAAGTHIYTWADGDLVFLLIGTDAALNEATIAALSRRPAATPLPTASPEPAPPTP
jgi:hypothetical protein